jgi:hypothetical protein
MSLSSVDFEPNVPGRVAAIFLFLYFAAVVTSSIRRSDRRLSSVATPLVAAPLLIGAAASWISVARLYFAMSIVPNAGVASRSVGLAAAQAPLVFAAIVGAALTLGAAISHRLGMSQPASRAAVLRRSRGVCAVAAFSFVLVAGELAFATVITPPRPMLLRWVAGPLFTCIAVLCALGGVASTICLIRARSRDLQPDAPHGLQRALIGAAFCCAVAVTGYLLIGRLTSIAMTGRVL